MRYLITHPQTNLNMVIREGKNIKKVYSASVIPPLLIWKVASLSGNEGES